MLMLTTANASPTNSADNTSDRPRRTAGVSPFEAQKVVIVNGNAAVLESLETLLEAGHYDIVFVESVEHAYTQIKRVQPNLVVLYMGMDDVHSLQVLSMLKLDEDTVRIPVITYMLEWNGDDEEEDSAEESLENEMLGAKPQAWMN
jgi:PleD family two-component response regulator